MEQRNSHRITRKVTLIKIYSADNTDINTDIDLQNEFSYSHFTQSPNQFRRTTSEP